MNSFSVKFLRINFCFIGWHLCILFLFLIYHNSIWIVQKGFKSLSQILLIKNGSFQSDFFACQNWIISPIHCYSKSMNKWVSFWSRSNISWYLYLNFSIRQTELNSFILSIEVNKYWLWKLYSIFILMAWNLMGYFIKRLKTIKINI
jgi:hypothetical protein